MNSALPAVLTAFVILLLVSRPGGWAMSAGVIAAGRRGVGSVRRPSWLTSEALAHPPDHRPYVAREGSALTVVAEPDDRSADLDRVAALVDLARAGDNEAFGRLFDEFHGPVFRQLYAQTRSRALAEDLTSETFFKALRAIGGFNLPSHLFGPWLRKIARNLAHDHFKSSRARFERSTDDFTFYEELAEGPEEAFMAILHTEELRVALTLLPVNQRRALALRFLLQKSITETAAQLGCTEGAAKQLQWRGLRNLARILREDLGD